MIWLIFTAMLAVALAGLLRPLLRPSTAGAARVAYDLTVYGDQLDEIGRDVERGLLSADQAGAARTEVQRRMLAASETDKTAARPDVRAGKRIALAIVVVMPLAALGVYLTLGAPELPDRPYAERAAEITQMKERAAFIQSMVTRLAEKLKADPADGKGWAMLARSYRQLGEADQAKEAYAKALPLLPAEIQPRLEYAMLLLDEAEGDAMPPLVVTLMDQVLALDANQPDALYFTGLNAAWSGDKAKARAIWTRLLMVLPAVSPAREQVQQQLDGLK